MCRRPDQAVPSREAGERGFTLLEVVAALLIAAVALTCLIQSETTSIRSAGVTRDLREASILGYAKLQELSAGWEQEPMGSFETREGWTWEATREPFEGGFGARKITLTVTYSTAGGARTLQLEQVVP